MLHKIVNQNGKYIVDDKIRTEIKDALDKDKDHLYFDNIRIDIELDVKCIKERLTKVRIEGIWYVHT